MIPPAITIAIAPTRRTINIPTIPDPEGDPRFRHAQDRQDNDHRCHSVASTTSSKGKSGLNDIRHKGYASSRRGARATGTSGRSKLPLYCSRDKLSNTASTAVSRLTPRQSNPTVRQPFRCASSRTRIPEADHTGRKSPRYVDVYENGVVSDRSFAYHEHCRSSDAMH